MANRRKDDAGARPARTRKRTGKPSPGRSGEPGSGPDIGEAGDLPETHVELGARLSAMVGRSATPELAFSEVALQGALSVLLARASRFALPPICCRCSGDPKETNCQLFTLDAQGQYRPSGQVPRSQAGNYSACG